MDSKQLDALVQAQAKQAGMSSKQAKQALKKLREGGLMAQIAPQLQQAMSGMNPTQTPRDRLKAKLNNARLSRSTKETKTAVYEKQKEEAHQREEAEKEAKEKAVETAKRSKRAHQLKLKELEKKIGKVQEKLYLECLTRQKSNQYKDEGERNRDRNLIDLYSKQQEFSTEINMDDL